MARPKGKTINVPTKFFTLIAKGASVRLSCTAVGLARETVYHWIRQANAGTDDPEIIEFYNRYQKSLSKSIVKLFENLEAADEEDKKSVKQDGKELTQSIKKSPASHAKWLLSRRYPEDFSLNHLEPEVIEDDDDTENDSIIGITDWRNPDLFAFRSPACMEIVNFKGSELVVSGPTRCGKTLRILEYLFNLHFANPGLRSLIVRDKETDLRDTVKVDIRETLLKFDLDDPLSPIKARGGVHNFTHLEMNGGTMTFGGMDRPGKVLGSKYDVVFFSQIEQSNPEQFQKLKTRVAGDSKNWIDPVTGEVRFLFVGDANPAQKKHYLLEREADESMATQFIHFGFDDNPLFFRGGKRTPDGDRVINELDRSLTGIYHDRLFKGLWVSAEGVVFREFDERRHVKQIEKPSGVWVTGIDFGYESPSVLHLCCLDEDGKVTVWREVYKTGLTLDDLITELRTLWAEEGIDSNVLVIDHDAAYAEQLKREGFGVVLAEKEILAGIELIRSRLKQDQLIINEFANKSPDLSIDKGPRGLVDEFGVYSYKPPEKQIGSKKDDIPIDSDNHGIDTLRYVLKYFYGKSGYFPIGESFSYGTGHQTREIEMRNYGY